MRKKFIPFEKSGMAQTKKIVAISSCKGGVGKSTVACLLALEMCRRGFKTGLLDLDLYGPSLPLLFDINQRVVLKDNNGFIPHQSHGLQLMSMGFLIGQAPAVMRGPIATTYTQNLLHKTVWGSLDFLFIDMPPGTGDIHLTITQTVPLRGSVIVTTRQALSLSDVARGILMFEKVNVPLLGFVENMVYTLCDQCENRSYLFGDSNTSIDLSLKFGAKILAELPLEKEWMHQISSQKHKPLIKRMGDQFLLQLNTTSNIKNEPPLIEKKGKTLILHWKHSKDWEISYQKLRSICSCAYCVDEFTQQSRIDVQKISQQIKPVNMQTLGNYALSIEWSDGHRSGIYSYKSIETIKQNSH